MARIKLPAPEFRRLTKKRIHRIALNADGDLIASAAEGLVSGFIWRDSPEGQDYWEAVYDRLVEMASKVS